MCINVCSIKIKQNLNMSKLATAFDSGLTQQVPGKSASTTAPHVQVAAVKISVNKEPRQRRFTQMPTSIYKQNTTDRPQGPLEASDNVSSELPMSLLALFILLFMVIFNMNISNIS